MMKRVLVYYPFAVSKKADSGSKLRPVEMLKAFQQWGKQEQVEIIEIHGHSSERENQFEELKQKGILDNLLFCYMENQTIPIWLTDPGHIPKKPFIDRKVLNFLNEKNVPVGIFYRDVYWKFDELYPLKGIKKKVMQFIYRREEAFYQEYMDAIFLPSAEMGKHVHINVPKVALPPGGKDTSQHQKEFPGINGLYVGGINNPDYGLPLLLDALERVNQNSIKCKLTVVCRENEYEALSPSEKHRLTDLDVELQHISGQELTNLYQKMDFAFIPRYRSEYNDFSVPVKLVEYLSHHLPVIATDCSAQKSFIESGNYGVVCQDNPDSMAEAILQMLSHSLTLRKNIEETFMEKHSWLSRVKTVQKTLMKEEL
jgi:glycosyltransferase involved in cell wall biosynthesis